MAIEVILVCGLNILIFLGLLGLLPTIWGLRSALATTAEKMNEWSGAAEAALRPTPATLMTLRATLRTGRGTLNQTQKRIKVLGTLVGLGRRFLKQLRTS